VCELVDVNDWRWDLLVGQASFYESLGEVARYMVGRVAGSVRPSNFRDCTDGGEESQEAH